MTRIILVRHGQAQTHATDEASYDNLSALGHDQARWLGDYVAASNLGVSRIISGNLKRQKDTASYLASSLDLPVVIDARLNEIDYFSLAGAMQGLRAAPVPASRDDFLLHFPQVMAAWAEGEISCPRETFADYEERVLTALGDAETHPGTMLVTSGGIIGMAMRHVLGLSVDSFSHVLLQIHNASLHQVQIEAGDRRLVSFNGTPHLDAPDRTGARTFV